MPVGYDFRTALTTAQFDINTAADKAIITIPFKCRVHRAFVVVEGTDANTATIKFDKRPTAGSDTSRGDGDVAVINLTAANNQGKMFYKDPTTSITLKEGEQVVVEVTAEGGGAKNAVAGLLVDFMPEEAANNTNMVATA